jgi:alpha-D-ribose 1-methylphosphonate 5-triphosphate synthase subunit PhnG
MNRNNGDGMQANDVTAVVLYMNPSEVDEMIGLLAGEEITIVRPPKTGLMMMTVRDSFATDFHLGEVLTTEAEVSLGGETGYGMVIGEEPRKALARAAVDALLRSGRPADLCRQVRSCLERAEQRQTGQQAADAALVAATKVSFDLMPGA